VTAEIGATVREQVLAASTAMSTIDAVVLTTFGFNADFVEDHALPAVLGMDGDASPGRRQAVHEALGETPVTVLYDATTASVPSGRYRFTAVPVPLVGRLFHPKTIAVAGRDREGQPCVWLGVGSANLTMSGWGRNVESFGGVWVTASDSQPAEVLTALTRWMGGKTGLSDLDEGSGLARLLTVLEALPSTAEAAVDASDAGARVYASPVHEAGFPAFVKDVAAGCSLRVFSPYWSDVASSAAAFGATSVSLVPALRSDGHGVGLEREQASDLPTECSLLRNAGDAGDRFWHAKAYEFLPVGGAGDSPHVAVGSCNFSSPGLRGGTGNVEAMLVRPGRLLGRPMDELLSPLDLDELSSRQPEDDDAPTPLPVGMVLIWDWATEEYRWLLNDGGKGRVYRLWLTDDVTHDLGDARGSFDGAPPARGATFELTWAPDGKQTGAVVEINLHLSSRPYGRRLKAAEILDSWRGRPIQVGGDGDLGTSDGAWHEGFDEESAASELPFDAFDLYDFYRSIRQLGERILEHSERPSVQRAMLVTRPDSLWALAQLAAGSDTPAALRFLVLSELELTATAHLAVLDAQVLDRLQVLTAKARRLTLIDLDGEVSDPERAAEMLAWFEAKASGLGVPA
jgi:hypothetical protein